VLMLNHFEAIKSTIKSQKYEKQNIKT
jgi:hypothetical protein